MSDTPSKYRALIFVLTGGGVVAAGLFAYEFFYRFPIWTLRAFKVPSRSMCPTICEGERVFVEMQYGKLYKPKRGEVIVFNYGPDQAKFIKRVVGLPGDIVTPGPNDTILVNDRPWPAPAICAKSLLPLKTSTGYSAYSGFKATRVAPGQVFVIGDNLSDSLDSRLPQFEPVTFEQIVGKPVLIYWSPDSARIGCPVQ